MIDDIENNEINMIVTKDLSRLGRDYIKTGYYVEDYFPTKKVRYISLLDGIDTHENSSNNDIAPFKALFNDMVSKDTSRKIKSILKNKKEQGLFLGSKAPYGYKKDKDNKNKLVIDEYESNIVKMIFELSLANKSNNDIAKILNVRNIPSPSNKKWTSSSIYNILNNREYTGCLVSNVWTSISYKNKTRIKRSQREWIIKENTHEKIIDVEIYEKLKQRNKYNKGIYSKKKLLFEGLVYCNECGSLLGASYIKKRGYYILNCNKYKKDSNSCSSHYINYSKLEEFVITRLKSILKENNYNKDITNNLVHSLIDKITISRNKMLTIKYKFKNIAIT